MNGKNYDICVVGAGSGGIGAAITAGKLGLCTLLLEKSAYVGGTAAWAGVNNWEPCVGATPLAHHIYREMCKFPFGAGITSVSAHICRGDHVPGGILRVDPCKQYAATLGSDPLERHSVVFEPLAYSRVVESELAAAGVDFCPYSLMKTINVRDGRIVNVTLESGDIYEAPIYIDSSGGNVLAKMAGCTTVTSPESHHIYKEPSAPEVIGGDEPINGATLVFRIGPGDGARVEPLPMGIPRKCWWANAFPYVFMAEYPNGDFQVNALPLMEGREVMGQGHTRAYEECYRRVLALWHHIQLEYEQFREFRILSVSPVLGVRQGCRLRSQRVLTECDIRKGLSNQESHDLIAIADHPLDVHGAGHLNVHMHEPYGIPFGCLVPREIKNLLVASRGAGFSHIAAASCRLSRTMMALGEVAGHASYHALNKNDSQGIDVAALDVKALRSHLRKHAHPHFLMYGEKERL